MRSNGTGWSDTGTFTAADAAKLKSAYPNTNMPSWWKGKIALVTKMTVETKPAPIGVNGSSLTTVQCEITPPASSASDSPEVITLEGLLFGNLLG